MRGLTLAAACALTTADPAVETPVPPCYVPWVGKTFEVPCTTTVFSKGTFSIRRYGLPSQRDAGDG